LYQLQLTVVDIFCYFAFDYDTERLLYLFRQTGEITLYKQTNVRYYCIII